MKRMCVALQHNTPYMKLFAMPAIDGCAALCMRAFVQDLLCNALICTHNRSV